jgi:hypothetical protein
MVQNTSRASFGSFSGGRSTMAENSARWLGIMGSVMARTSTLATTVRTLVAQQLSVQNINSMPETTSNAANSF